MTGERDDLARVLGEHRVHFASNDHRIWNYCRCNPDVELIGIDSTDVLPIGHPFYLESLAAEQAHLADVLAAHLAERDERVRRETLTLFADESRDRMAEAWGGSAAWFTTGEKVANVVCDWLRAEGLG